MIRSIRAKAKYDANALVRDCFGGLTAALIALPYGLTMAAMMGLPPALGLFTSLLTTPITFLLGRNPVLIGGPSTVTVPFIAGAVASLGVAGAAKITLIAAVFMLGFSVLRLGRFILRIPPTVVSGFSCGIGVMMIVAQLKTLLGLTLPAGLAQQTALQQLVAVVPRLGGVHWEPLVLGSVVLVCSFAVAARWKLLPAPLIGVAVSMGVSLLLGLHEKEVGRLSIEFPPLATFVWSPGDLDRLLLPGFALAFVASVNLLVTSRVVEHFRGRQRGMKPSDADGELGAYGIANVCVGMFGAPLSVGIPARSIANVRCGGSTRLSNLAHGAMLFACLWFGADLVSRIPMASLAGVTAYVGICLLEWSIWRRLHRLRPVEAVSFLLTCASTLVANPVVAVALGCAVHGAGAVRGLVTQSSGRLLPPPPAGHRADTY